MFKKLKRILKDIAEGLSIAIGETMFGGKR